MKYLFCFDLDGTLLKQGNELSDYTVRQIKKIKEQGHICCLVTGRALASAIDIYNKLELDTIIANEDGRVISNPSDPKFKRVSSLIPNLEAKRFYNAHKDSFKETLFELNNHSYASDVDGVLKMWGNFVPEPGNILDYEEDYNAFIVLIKDEDIDKAQTDLEENYEHISLRLWPGSPVKGYTLAEVHSLLFDKGTAVRYIKNYYQGEYDKCCVFGDSRNDYGMFKEADISVAMKNAPRDVRSMARYQTTYKNFEDGVVRYIDELLNRKLFFIDLDGTILNSESELSEETVNYIRSIKDNHLVVINTGRPYLASIGIYNDLHLNTLLAVNNGRNIIDPKDLNNSIQNNVTRDNAYKILNETIDMVKTYRFDKDCICYQKEKKIDMLFYSKYHSIITTSPSENVDDFDSCFYLVYEDRLYDFMKHVKENYPNYNVRTLYTKDGITLCEVIIKGFTKSFAVAYLMDYYHVPYDNVYVIGDGQNDQEMVRDYQSAAPKNANVKCLEYADYLIDSNDDNGVIKFMKEILAKESDY